MLLPHGAGYVHVSDDPDRDWARLEPYFWYDAESYRSWQPEGQASEVTSKARTPEELRDEGQYRVLTPDECVAYAESLGPMGALVLHPLIAGIPPEWGWESLELFRSKVAPRLQGAA